MSAAEWAYLLVGGFAFYWLGGPARTAWGAR